MPDTICAAMREGSPVPPDVMVTDSMVKAAAPTATSTLVRRPALCWRYCRSMPMSVPMRKAQPVLTIKSISVIIALCF